MSVELRVPDLGDFKDVPVIDVLIQVGDEVEVDQGLITLETDKASIDVPAAKAGRIVSLALKKGDRCSAGTLIGELEPAAAESAATTTVESAAPATAPPATSPAASRVEARASAEPDTQRVGASSAHARDLIVIGAGPGGYTAAFRAADLGLKVTLIERWDSLGGVCLNVGCIPSKALLHAAKVIEDAHDVSACGVDFGAPSIDRARLREWKSGVVTKLTGGLAALAKRRKVDVVRGVAKFTGPTSVEVEQAGEFRTLEFRQCIIAVGSESATLPGWPSDPRIMNSSDALELPEGCRSLLVVGGGIIGLELACVYDGLGAQVSVVEIAQALMPGTDADLVKPLKKRIEARYRQLLLNTRVSQVEPIAKGLRVSFDGPNAPRDAQMFDRILVAVGRRANGNAVAARAAGVSVNDAGLIAVDRQMRTNVPHIFAIGDVVGAPMLAHKATHEAKVAAEAAAGHRSFFDAKCIPAVAYTDPEIAWVGLTEAAAAQQKLNIGRSVFPWAASGRALAMNRAEGFTKILFDKDTHRVVGAGIVGAQAGELIAEAALAIEMGADATDLGNTIHPHPTLSETLAMAAQGFEGTLTDI